MCLLQKFSLETKTNAVPTKHSKRYSVPLVHQDASKKELEHLVKKIKTSVRQRLTNGVQSTFNITKEACENSLDKTSS